LAHFFVVTIQRMRATARLKSDRQALEQVARVALAVFSCLAHLPRLAASNDLSRAGSSRCEHLLQRPQHRQHGLRIQFAERSDQPLSIDGAQLIQGDNAGAALETASRPPWALSLAPSLTAGTVYSVRTYQ
jgi:hypothetical protein